MEPHDRRAVDKFAKLFQRTLLPPIAAEGYLRIGRHCRQREDFAAAISYYDFARDLFRRHNGKRDADYLAACQELVRVRIDMADLRPLEADARELVDLFTKTNGPDNPVTLTALEDLLLLRRLTNQIEPAGKILGDLVAKTRPAAGPPGRDHIRLLNQLGLLRRQAGKLDEAAKFFEQCVEAHAENFSAGDASYAAYLANAALAQQEIGQLDKAETTTRRALALYEKRQLKHDKLQPRLAAILEARVGPLLAAGKTDDAQKALTEAAAHQETVRRQDPE